MDRNARTAFLCFSLAAGMIGAAYAAVPFYRWFCQVTGFEGTTQRADAAPDASGISDRVIRVRFDANVAPGLTWNFGPVDPYIDIRVGDVGITS